MTARARPVGPPVDVINVSNYAGTVIGASAFQQAVNDAEDAGKGLWVPPGMTVNLGAGNTIDAPPGFRAWFSGRESPVLCSTATGTEGCAIQSRGFDTPDAIGDVYISGAHFERTTEMDGTEGPRDAAVRMHKGENLVFVDCSSIGFSSGVFLEGNHSYHVRGWRAYSPADCAFRIAEGHPEAGWGDFEDCQDGLVEDCWAFNCGYEKDGITLVGSVGDLIGSAFVPVQGGVRVIDCGAVNSRLNALEMGNDRDGVTVNGFHSLTDIGAIGDPEDPDYVPARSGRVLVANIQNVTLRNMHFDIDNGATGGILVAGLIGLAGNTIGQTFIDIAGVTGRNRHTEAGFIPDLVRIQGTTNNVAVEGVYSRGYRGVWVGNDTVEFVTVRDGVIIAGPEIGAFFEGGGNLHVAALELVANVVGMTVAGVGDNCWFERCRAFNTAVMGGQVYGYEVIGPCTVNWVQMAAWNNTVAPINKVNAPTLVTSPDYTS